MKAVVTRKELSNGLQAILINDGMTVSEIVRVLGIPRQTIEDHVKSHGFSASRISGEQLQALKNQRVIPLKARKLSIIPQTAIESLVRFIATPETDAIYNQLWTTAHNVYEGNFLQAGLDVGLDVDTLIENFEGALNLAKQMRIERDQALAAVVETKEFAADHAEEHGLTSIAIIKKYPEQSKKLIDETKPKIKNLTKYGPSGILTVGLKHNGITSKIARITPKGPAQLFNTKEVDDFMKGY